MSTSIEWADRVWNPIGSALPLRWKKPLRVSVNIELFHELWSFDRVAAVFGIMASAPQHTYRIVTKRPDRMGEFFAWLNSADGGPLASCLMAALDEERERHPLGDSGPLHTTHCAEPDGAWPLPNVQTRVEKTRNAR